MCQTNLQPKNRTCIICEKQLYGRSDKVFCDIHCKNKYHSEIRKTTRTVSAETLKMLQQNWVILAGLMTDNCDRFILKKVTLERLGFKFDTISHVESRGLQLRYSVFEFSYYFGHQGNVVVTKDIQQESVSPFLFKRWSHVRPALREEYSHSHISRVNK